MKKALKINPKDNIVVAVERINPGDKITFDNLDGEVLSITAIEEVPIYHKVSIVRIPKGENIVKYGEHIGVASTDIEVGMHVHVKNVDDNRENLKAKE